MDGDSMNMNGGGMDMAGGSMTMGGCTTHMLWTWDTIGSCFLAESWRIQTAGMMAGSCIGVFLLAVLLEFVRRLGKEYDRSIVARAQHEVDSQAIVEKEVPDSSPVRRIEKDQALRFRPTLAQQLIRGLIHAVSFGIAYILMLIAMSYNGYLIIMTILGAGFGKVVADWTTQKIVVGAGGSPLSRELNSSEEATVCCG
ncbi:ctr copper transporter [Nemania sp. FL0916]|nr:ctr copper transporter [Nemania sp. FL0916]